MPEAEEGNPSDVDPGSPVPGVVRPSPPLDFDGLGEYWFVEMRKCLHAMGCPPADIDDLASETIKIAYCKRKSFTGGNARAWLRKIAWKLMANHRRTPWYRISWLSPATDATLGRQHDRQPSPEETVSNRELLGQAEELFSRMPAGLREVLMLSEVYGYSDREIAERAGISDKTVTSRLYRARQLFLKLSAKELRR